GRIRSFELTLPALDHRLQYVERAQETKMPLRNARALLDPCESVLEVAAISQDHGQVTQPKGPRGAVCGLPPLEPSFERIDRLVVFARDHVATAEVEQRRCDVSCLGQRRGFGEELLCVV